MSANRIALAIEGPIARLTLDRPDKLNAIDAEMVGELTRALDRAESEAGVRVITLAGNGRAFCAGFDLSELRPGASEHQTRDMLENDFALIMRFWHSPKPTIAAVQGYALGGGFELAMACDMTIAAEGAFFGVLEHQHHRAVEVGVNQRWGGHEQATSQRLAVRVHTRFSRRQP